MIYDNSMEEKFARREKRIVWKTFKRQDNTFVCRADDVVENQRKFVVSGFRREKS